MGVGDRGYMASKVYYAAHRTERLAYMKAYFATHKVEIAAYRATHKAEIAARAKAYNAAHKAEATARHKVYRAAHKAEAKAYRDRHKAEIVARDRIYRETHKSEYAGYRAAYRQEDADRSARRRAATLASTVETVSRAVVFARDGGRCHICGKLVGKSWHLDHIVPLAEGGAHSYLNVAVACPKCNMWKYTKRGFQLRLLP